MGVITGDARSLDHGSCVDCAGCIALRLLELQRKLGPSVTSNSWAFAGLVRSHKGVAWGYLGLRWIEPRLNSSLQVPPTTGNHPSS